MRAAKMLTSALPVLALLLALTGCEQAPPMPEPIRPVRVVTATPQPFEARSTYTGEVRARIETNMAFRIGGKIVARFVEIGSEVRKGSLLARLDPEDTRLAIENARAQVNAALADYNQAQTDLGRFRRLLETRVISQAEFDRRQTISDSAAARLESARSQLRVSQNQMGYTELHAESDGVVTALGAEAGQVVAAGQTVLRLARPEEKEVVFNVAENRLDELRGASQIRVSLWSQPDLGFDGVVREIAPGADPVTRTYAVKVAVKEATAAMRLGMTASVTIIRSGGDAIVPLPLTALYQQGPDPAVWIFDPATETVALRPVRVVSFVEKYVLIGSGLKAGEKVVTAGVHKLIPNQKVRLLPEVAAARAAS